MAPHSSTLAWKIPWMEEPGRLQSMGSLRVGHNSVTSLSLFTFMHWRRKWQPAPVFLPRIPGTGEPGGLLSMGSHRVGHNWSNLAAAAAAISSSPGTTSWLQFLQHFTTSSEQGEQMIMKIKKERREEKSVSHLFDSSCLSFGASLHFTVKT